jgi:cell division septal protein FtsQ
LIANGVLLALEVGLVGVALTGPALRPVDAEVQGTQHLTPAEIRLAARIPSAQSVLLLPAGDVVNRVERLPWVRSARVELGLPNRVRIDVVEWSPVAVLRVRESALYLGENGRILGPAGEDTMAPTIVAPFAEDRAGRVALDPRLLAALRKIAAEWEPTYGIGLKEFRLDRNLELTAVTTRGWRVLFGQMATSTQRNSLEGKLRALKAVQAKRNFQTDPIDYINVMNEQLPTDKTLAPPPPPAPASPSPGASGRTPGPTPSPTRR